MTIIVFTSFGIMFDIGYIGYEDTLPGNGLMLNMLGMLIAFIGGIMSKKEYGQLPMKAGFQKSYQQQGYQQPPQQAYQQQAYGQQPQSMQNPVTQPQAYQETGLDEDQFEENYCSSCGQKGDPSALFCNNCGSKY